MGLRRPGAPVLRLGSQLHRPGAPILGLGSEPAPTRRACAGVQRRCAGRGRPRPRAGHRLAAHGRCVRRRGEAGWGALAEAQGGSNVAQVRQEWG